MIADFVLVIKWRAEAQGDHEAASEIGYMINRLPKTSPETAVELAYRYDWSRSIRELNEAIKKRGV